uniref:Uncharacterized protein n=1 Tax=Vespula pensylvanica TaxID=30213 RepID=A0A834U9T8_VESPE|nr:hypothetical protein H0235_009186 [Vespula pensylvanica]
MLRCMKKCSQLLNEIDNEQVTWNLVFMQSAERIPYEHIPYETRINTCEPFCDITVLLPATIDGQETIAFLWKSSLVQ